MRLPWIFCPNCNAAVDPPDDERLPGSPELLSKKMNAWLQAHMKGCTGAGGEVAAPKKRLPPKKRKSATMSKEEAEQVGREVGKLVGILLEKLVKGR